MVDKYGEETSTHPSYDPQVWLKTVVSDGLNRNWVCSFPTVSI